jgi:3-methyladenine DNA glycosylase Tag
MPRTRKTSDSAAQVEAIQDNAVAVLHCTVATMQNLMQQVVDQANGGISLKELLQMLDTLGKTSNRLSALLKDRKALAGGEDLADFLNQALAEVVQEMGESSKRPAPNRAPRSLRQAQGTELSDG